ncbi:MAG: TOMM precursor leader peptide-binding protein [Gammaproteobacteria bacterium]|nr:TOMM precursor leader peptide-binding protein [Gammaproteobacteria bacterium]MCY4211871.1 TOMM precursor leader peptide-binding protein [Gammaproteobacteria bacterium]
MKVSRRTDADTGLIEQPALAPHFTFHALDESQVFLISEAANTLLHGHIYPRLLPLLDGRRSFPELVAALAEKHTEASVRTALVTLAGKGYIVSGEHDMDAGTAAFWTALGASPRFARERLAAAPVTITGNAGSLDRRLEAMGVKVTADGAGAALAVIVCDDYLNEQHARINQQHLASGIPWMLLRPSGLQPLFGPIFRPAQQGPCWACLAYRLRGHQEIHNFLRNLTDGDIALAPKAVAPAAVEAVTGVSAVEIAKWLVFGATAALHEHAISFDTVDLTLQRHPIMRRPQCLACGDEALYRNDREPRPVRLQASPKRVRNSGGVRSVPAEQTLAKYRHLIGPVGGVITWLRRTTDATDPWLHVHWAGSNLALKNRTLEILRRSLRTKSAGKGSTARQSEVSALCEALERYCGAFHGDEIYCRKRFTDFAASAEPDAIHPNAVQLFSELQLDDAARINAGGHPYNVVPPRLDPEAETDWSPVWSLTRARTRYLPTSLLYYAKSTDGQGFTDFVADSNGCAAGNTLEEAILQGFFELVERDAFAVWWYNQLRVPAVDLTSFDDDYLASASAYYQGLQRELWVLDVTGDLGIPTFVALSRRTDKQAEDIIYGAGAHLDPHLAVLRAVCELNQCLNAVQGAGPGGSGYQVDDPQSLWWLRNATLAKHPYLAPAAEAPRGKASYPVPETEDVRADVEHCQALVEAKGLEFLVLDQTRPDIGLPVVRVIVPGMRHYWARFAPGRLYEVPVAMGWREQALTEQALNPAPVIA